MVLFSEQIDQLDAEDGAYRASSSANVILYVGLGMVAIGLVITFVGLGDKGFRYGVRLPNVTKPCDIRHIWQFDHF